MSKNKRTGLVIILLLGLYFIGPQPQTPKFSENYPSSLLSLEALNDSINSAEAGNDLIKTNNQARIVWANDSLKQKTPLAIVYLHGFSASQEEGAPTHRNFAKRYGANLYLARLEDHGLKSDDPLLEMTPDRLWESAKKALSIGEQLGEKIIVMSTSTGGTLGIYLASRFPEKIDALINFSPNIRINNFGAELLNDPWGLYLSRAVMGGRYMPVEENDPEYAKYWSTGYRMEATVQLQELVEQTMTEANFQKVKCPSLSVAYYKNDEEQDPVVKVDAIEWMHNNLGSDANSKVFVKLPNVGNHVLAGALRSKDLGSVKSACEDFAENILQLEPME